MAKRRGAQYRQGDLLFVRVGGLPAGSEKLNHRVLAEGETTGHMHQIVEETAHLYEAGDEEGARLFVEAIKQSLVVHEEHATITLPEGVYEVVRQREYDPAVHGRRSRTVED